MEITDQTTIGEIVAQDFRTAALFSKYKIDFCCKGNRTVEEVCSKKNIAPNDLLNQLTAILKGTQTFSIDYRQWPLDLLIDYIEKIHHRYVEEKIPLLSQFLNKLCNVHGQKHPELLEINSLFQESAGELSRHLKKEELILFPFIKQMVKAQRENQPYKKPHFDHVTNPINMMKQEHDTEGERFVKIAELTDNYTPPSDACTTYKVTFAMLHDFENDLHKHIHLENNILFPKAIALEDTLLNQ